MTQRGSRLSLIASGMQGQNLRLQPWRYLSEVARQLARQNYRVTVITDGGRGETSADGHGVQWVRLPSVRSPFWKRNTRLAQAVASVQPDYLLWHIGLTNIVYETLPQWPQLPVVGIFTTPIYSLRELLRLGGRKLGRNLPLCGMHLAGTLLSRRLIHARLKQNHLAACVVQTHTTKVALLQQHILSEQIEVIPPGVDAVWLAGDSSQAAKTRHSLGYVADDFVVLYLGAPAELRGLPDLIEATGLARRAQPALQLLILNRSHTTGSELRRWLHEAGVQDHTQIIDGYLEPQRVAELVRASDVVALPFELVPSDAPLSLLEVKASGRPLITTSVACLPELANGGTHVVAKPADPAALAAALLVAGTRRSAPSLFSPQPRPARSWSCVGEEWTRLLQAL